ncbi:MAG: winged helix-turn-helix domain-containing protein [Dongiaceae bacterium]
MRKIRARSRRKASQPPVVDVSIRYFRQKIDGHGEKPLIQTVRGIGHTISAD